MRNSRKWALSGLLALALPPTLPAQEPPPRPFLRKVIQLDEAQLAAMERGEVVTKLLPSPEKPEIAAFGIVRVNGTLPTLREPEPPPNLQVKEMIAAAARAEIPSRVAGAPPGSARRK